MIKNRQDLDKAISILLEHREDIEEAVFITRYGDSHGMIFCSGDKLETLFYGMMTAYPTMISRVEKALMAVKAKMNAKKGN